MSKRKDLLLKESTTRRFMTLAGIPALSNPFLRENKEEEDEEELDEIIDPVFNKDKEMDEGFGDYDVNLNQEEKEVQEESIKRSIKRLKRLLEQADMPPPPKPKKGGNGPEDETADGSEDEEMPPMDDEETSGGDEMESKIKDFVKQLGALVQDTLGVEVTVEDGEGGDEEMPEEEKGDMGDEEMPPADDEEAPAPIAEAINRLVNKIANRVKVRLMEAKKADPKAKAAKMKKMKLMKEKQAASKKKEAEAKKKKMASVKKKVNKNTKLSEVKDSNGDPMDYTYDDSKPRYSPPERKETGGVWLSDETSFEGIPYTMREKLSKKILNALGMEGATHLSKESHEIKRKIYKLLGLTNVKGADW